MLEISVEFHSGRFHATPWGRHPREGEAEWPPSPWRLMRALVSAYYRDSSDTPVSEVLVLLRHLSHDPEYRLPFAAASHTRQYHPQANSKQLMFDAFVDVREPLFIRWPNVTLSEKETELLSRLLSLVGYFGRAESWAELKVSETCSNEPSNCYSSDAQGGDPVRVLSAANDVTWEQLCCRTGELQKAGWSAPPGSRWVTYYRACNCFSGRPYRQGSSSNSNILAARYVYSTGLRPRRALTLYAAETIRTHLLSFQKDMSNVAWHNLSGKVADDQKPQDQWKKSTGQRHLYVLPLRSANPKHLLGDVLLFRREGLSLEEQNFLAMLPARQEYLKAIHPLTFVEFLGEAELGRAKNYRASRRWRSVTPYLHTRHFKNGPRTPQVVEQIRKELEYFGLTGLAETANIDILEGKKELDGIPLQEYKTQRRQRPRPNSGIYLVELEFTEAIRGPIALGYGSHFGLGQFEPV